MTRPRQYSLDCLRIIATVLIVFHHYQQVTGAYFQGKINFSGGRFYFGYVVEFFFLLSGFFMYSYVRKIQKEDLAFRQYIERRFVRLLPLVLISGIAYEIFLYYYTEVIGQSWFDISISIWGARWLGFC